MRAALYRAFMAGARACGFDNNPMIDELAWEYAVKATSSGRDRRKGARIQESETRRIDPHDCQCTDCQIGESLPDRRAPLTDT